jgi:hypothetical protein
MTIIANGRLRHHFWGEYSATIGLHFATADLAAAAAPKLAPFHVSETVPEALVFHGSGDALKNAEAVLEAHGADMAKVGSLAKSIDFGEPFTVEVDLTPDGPAVEQLALF